jgi:L-amino acid N-acyltransferase YncA
MKFLIDTNIVLPLEPMQGARADRWTLEATEFSRLALAAGHQIFVHPAARMDVARDSNVERREMRSIQFEKYPLLPDPPAGDSATDEAFGTPMQGSNEWVDNQLLIAVCRNAVDHVVTEDSGAHRKARKLGVDARVLRLTDAIDAIKRLSPTTAEALPLVQQCKVHSLDSKDPIFESFRDDYDDFDNWLKKAAVEHRDAWVIKRTDGGCAGVTIAKVSKAQPPERHLKICSFKIADEGQKYGELLLKALFEHCYANDYKKAYLTVYPHHTRLAALLEQFGFVKQPEPSGRGEDVFTKTMFPPDEVGGTSNDPFQYHVAYGPRFAMRVAVSSFIVPIQPKYHDLLFPEVDPQLALFPKVGSFGNAILKAYLCNASTRQIKPGDNLFFYRSTDAQSIRCTGVVERTLVSRDSDAIAQAVAKRTVYSLNAIKALANKPVLAILFRHSRSVPNGINYDTLHADQIVNGRPQSILALSDDRAKRLWTRLDQAELPAPKPRGL